MHSSAASSHLDDTLLPSPFAQKPSRKQSVFQRFKPQIVIVLFICIAAGLYFLSDDIIASCKTSSGVSSQRSSQNDIHEISANTSAVPPLPIAMRPYKDTNVRVPVVPSYGPAEKSQLGFDHIYIIHHLGHPETLARMANMLQLLRISAEFVPVLPIPEHQLPSPMVQSIENMIEWHTRHRIYRDMLEAGYKSALILDDSVDMELNIKTVMRAVHQNMPEGWDIFFPGHCGAFERLQPKPSAGFPALRLANMPICLHAHAVSRKGAKRILANLRPSPTSSEVFNMAVMRLKERGVLQAYSLDTPVFAPRPALPVAAATAAKAKAATAVAGADGKKGLRISAVDHLNLWTGKGASTR
ncbi:hypothetical protein IW150_000647 [Coemansia sp. RSA 2607]|nr:hypothetical protein IW150_000647 [Coemansia sp. RSA 2607]